MSQPHNPDRCCGLHRLGDVAGPLVDQIRPPGDPVTNDHLTRLDDLHEVMLERLDKREAGPPLQDPGADDSAFDVANNVNETEVR